MKTRCSRVTAAALLTVVLTGVLTGVSGAQPVSHACFDELPLGHSYSVGDEFTTLGIPVTVNRFFAVEGVPIFSGTASVEHFPAACQPEPTLNMSLTEACLGFTFAEPVARLEFQYGDFSDVLNLEVNGTLAIFHGFDQAPSPLGGVTVAGTGVDGQNCGKVVLQGQIHSLKIGGTSLWLDCIALESSPGAGTTFVRGDSNASGRIDMSDAVNVLGFLFLGRPSALGCEDAADVNDDGSIQLSDAVHLLNFLFLGSKPPAAPFNACGLDETKDALGCEEFAGCR